MVCCWLPQSFMIKSVFLCSEQEYVHHCRKNCGKDVPWSDRFEFVSGWYILIIISDTLTIVGSILKIEIQTKVMTGKDWLIFQSGHIVNYIWTIRRVVNPCCRSWQATMCAASSSAQAPCLFGLASSAIWATSGSIM